MQINARIDYALRAMLALAAAAPAMLSSAALAEAQDLPIQYLHTILGDLRRVALIQSHRGTLGGYTLTRPADQITVADVVTAIGGTLLEVRGVPAARTNYNGAAAGLQTVWLTAEDAMQQVLRKATLADLVASLPEERLSSTTSRAFPTRSHGA